MISPVFSVVATLVVLLASTSTTLAQLGTVTTSLNFCYGVYNTLTTSPYGPWSVSVQGRMTVVQLNATDVTQGWQVTGISGTRTMNYQGGNIVNQAILGLSAPNTYGYASNQLLYSAANIATFGTTRNAAISYMVKGAPIFAGGVFPDAAPSSVSNGNGYVQLNAYGSAYAPAGAKVNEMNQPVNDGITNILTSYFYVQLQTAATGYIFNCPNSVPAPSTSLVSTFAATKQYSFCVTHTGGPNGDGTVNGGNWTITTSGVITVAGYAGTVGGRTAYLVTNIVGTRSYVSQILKSTVNIVSVGGTAALFNLAQNQVGDFSLGTGDYANEAAGFGGFSNNVIYPTWPYFDSLGIALYTDNAISSELFGQYLFQGGSASTQVYRLAGLASNDGTLINISEFLIDFSWLVGYALLGTNSGGSMQLSAYTGVSYATYGLQCSFAPTYTSAATTPATFNWCYYLDSSPTSIVSAYGQMTAFGPITRDGRTDAYQVLSMDGVRTVTVNGQSTTQNIIALQYPDYYGNYNLVVNDNFVFVSAPNIDANGLVLQMAASPKYPNSASVPASNTPTPFIALSATTGNSFTEVDGFAFNFGTSSSPYGTTPATTNFAFKFALNSTAAPFPTTLCSAANANVPAPATTTVYSFCYYHLGSTLNFSSTTQGTMTVLNTPIVGPNGRTGNPVLSMTGIRQIADNAGFMSVNPITGVSSDYIGAQVGYIPNFNNEFFTSPSQLVYPNGVSGLSSPTYWDQNGILYAYGGGAGVTVGFADTVAPIARLLYDNGTTAYGYVEEIIYSITVNTSSEFQGNLGQYQGIAPTYYSEIELHGNAALVADNGVSGYSGMVAQLSCAAPATTQFSFCYTITNTLTTSPWLTWSVTVTGLMQVSSNYTRGEYNSAYQGYQVMSASGTRTIQYLGQTSTGRFTLAAINEYQFNDNIINLQAPYFAINTHSISFKMVNGVAAAFADGPLANNSPYFTINGYTSPYSFGAGITETDLPVNDGTANVIYSSFYMAFDYAGTNTCPPTGLPAYVAPTQAQLTAYTTVGSKIAFCWSHTGGPGGYGTTDGGAWQITSSGVFTLSGYLGTTGDGRNAYKIIAATGSRTYMFNNGSTQVVNFTSLGSVFAMGQTSALSTGQYEVGSFGTNFYSNNIYYTTYPQLDARGVSLIGAAVFDEEQETGIINEGGANENVIRVLIQPGFNNMLEYLWDPPTRYIFTNNGGYAQFTTYTNQNLTTYGAQCLYQAGTPAQYSYCYWLTGNNFATGAPYSIYAYGVATANGPSVRAYGTAVAVTAMTGVRSVTVNGKTTVQNIMNIEYPNQDLVTNTANTNLIFLSGGNVLDGLGLTFTLNSQPLAGQGAAVDANGLSYNADINVWIATGAGYNYGMYESSANYSSEVYNLAYIYTQTYGFSVAPFVSGGSLQQCSAPNTVIPIIPPLQTYSFCYSLSGSVAGSGALYTVSASGTMSVYSTPITNNGRIGYAIQSMTGTRRFQNVNGTVQTTQIVGVSADWIAGQQGWKFNQIFYPVAPFFDNTGVLIKYTGSGTSASGQVIARDPVIKLSYPTYPGGAMGETIYAASGATYVLNTNAGATVNFVADGGASASSVLSTCAAVTTQPTFQLNFCYGIYNTLPTSPYGLWSVSVTGRMTVQQVSATDITAGWLVTAMSGTRTLTSMGGVVTSQPIIGVAGIRQYGFNNNRLLYNATNTAAWDKSSYAISYQVKGPATFAGGVFPDDAQSNVANANGFISLNAYAGAYAPSGTGINEMNQPINDGITNKLTSYFYVLPFTTNTLNIFNCPYTVPQSSNALAYSFSQTQQFAFCVSHTGGPNGDGTVNGGNWTVTSSGVITVAGYGGSVNGRNAYLVTGVTGTRTYSSQTLSSTVNIVSVGGPAGLFNMAETEFGSGSFGSSDYVLQTEGFGGWSNNVFYDTYPYFDAFGLNFYTDAAITQEVFGPYLLAGGSASTQVFRIGVLPGNDGNAVNVNEFLIDYSWLSGYGELATNSGGSLVVAPYTGQSNFGTQCSFAPYSDYVNYYTPYTSNTVPMTYHFCYYIDNLASSPASMVSAYGQMLAFGPITRNGRSDAYQVTGISGVRTVTVGSTSVQQNIMALQYPNSYGSYVLNVNDNWVFKSAPNIDGLGLMMTMAASTFFPNNATLSTAASVNLALYAANAAGAFAEADGFNGISAGYNGATPASTKSGFAFAAYDPSSPNPPSTLCKSLDSNVPTPASTTVYSFCYYHLSTKQTFASTTQGTMTVVNAPIVGPNGMVGYTVVNMNGTRQIADNAGFLSVNPIIGVANDYQGAQVGYTVLSYDPNTLVFFSSPDQLIYPNQQSGLTGGTYFDQNGVLYRYGGTAGVTVGYADTVAQIARLKYDNSANNYGYLEEIIFSITTNSSSEFIGNLGQYNTISPQYSAEIELYGHVAIVADNGVSGAAGTVATKSCTAPSYTQFSFCYTITNVLTTSPWLTWSVTVTGLMNVSSSYTLGEYNNTFYGQTYGYQVLSATGTRTINYLGKTASGTFQLAAVNEYQFNDNIIDLQAPYLYDNAHSISFKMNSGAAVFADGPLNNSSPYFSVNAFSYPLSYGAGITESNLPVNDGTSQNIYSSFYMAFDYTGTNTCPPTGIPAYVAPSAQQVSLYNTVGSKVQFCWSHTGGPGGYGTYDGSAWQITSSGVFTLSGYAGTTLDGRTAYKIVAASGSRTYLYNNGSTQVVNFVGLGSVFSMGQVSSLAIGQFEVGDFSSNFYSNNIYYTTYPQLDNWGVSLIGTTDFVEEQESFSGPGYNVFIPQGGANENVIRVLIQPGFNNMLEYLWDPPTQYIWTNNGGYAQFVPYTGQNAIAFGQQCLYQAGTPAQYSYCYWLAGNNFIDGSPYSIYAYGVATANGPSSRAYGTAVAVTAMTGIRSVTVNGFTNVQNIMNIQYPNQDLGTNTANTNLIFVTGPAPLQVLDGLGLTFTLNSQPLNGLGGAYDANGIQSGSDINVWMSPSTGYGMYESSGSYQDEINTNAYIYTNNYNFAVSPYQPGAPLQQCVGAPASIPMVPALQTYSFCYALASKNATTGTQYVVAASGRMTVYSTPINNNGRVGYAIQSINGTRQWQSNSGQTQSTPIIGISADWVAGQQNWTFNQIFYPVAPFFDSTGILYKYSGNATSAVGNGAVVSRDAVIKLFYNAYPGGSLGEEIYTTTGQTFTLDINGGANVNFIGDNGASYAQIGATCGVTFPYNFDTGVFSGTGSSANSNSGSSSSSLSNGAIAGIVIGVVFGGIFTCLLCLILYCITVGAVASKPRAAAEPNSKYAAHTDEASKYTAEPSAVEMQTNEDHA